MIRPEERYLENSSSQAQLERRRKRQEQQEKKMAQAQQSKKARAQRVKRLLAAGGFLLAVAASVLAAAVAVNIFGLLDSKKQAQEQLDELRSKSAQLQNELSQVESREYVEQQARSELRMKFPNEVIYVIRGKDAPQEPAEEDGAKP